MSRLKLKEHFSGYSHLAGSALSVAALVVLLNSPRLDGWRRISFIIYGLSLVLLYSSSGVYHLFDLKPEVTERLRRLDHAGIFVLIAGTYTPVCLLPLRGAWGWSMLAAAWGIAIPGVILEFTWPGLPDWLDFILYIVMGWMAVAAFGPITRALKAGALHWLIAGGVLYTVGAVVYASGRPRLWPGRFGAHDLWHLFVLAGSAAHFMMILSFT